jgi:uncharacterized DUF497 family protein
MFDWDDDNEDHIAKHGFGRQDAENVLLDPHRVMVGAYNHRGEALRAGWRHHRRAHSPRGVYTKERQYPGVPP